MSPVALPDGIIELISKSDLFKGLNFQEIKNFSPHFYVCKKDTDQIIFNQNTPANKIFILIEGQVKIQKLTPQGQTVVVRMINETELLGCVGALSGGNYPASAVAVIPSKLLALDESSMFILMKEFPDIVMNAFQIMAGRNCELQSRYQELATQKVECRIAGALLRLMDHNGKKNADNSILIDMPLSRQDIAEMTVTTLFSVSRILSRWESEDIVESHREQVILKDISFLKAMSHSH